MEIEGVSEEREMKAIARKKKYDKELDGDAQLEQQELVPCCYFSINNLLDRRRVP